MPDIYGLAASALRFLPPEGAHGVTLMGLRAGLGPRRACAGDPVLSQRLWGLDFPNPVGLAAGFDKHAEVVDPLLDAGFGFVEAGTVTPLPQEGNPRPRVFRLEEDGAAINRLGFNSKGLARFTGHVTRRRRTGVVGANVGRNRNTENAAGDYAISVETLAPHVDYLAINISSPNTPGLRDLHGRAALEELLGQALEARDRADTNGHVPPLLIKVSPDLDEAGLLVVTDVARAMSIDGLILGNTTVGRPETLKSQFAAQQGGLSGRPLFDLSNRILADTYRQIDGEIPIIGCGGVASGDDAYVKIRAGASLIQLYTALVYHGPGLVDRIKQELAVLLKRDGFASVTDAVGADIQPFFRESRAS